MGLGVITTFTVVVAACVPPPADPPPEPAPTDIALMSDAQLDAALQELLPRVEAGYADANLRDAIPEDQQ